MAWSGRQGLPKNERGQTGYQKSRTGPVDRAAFALGRRRESPNDDGKAEQTDGKLKLKIQPELRSPRPPRTIRHRQPRASRPEGCIAVGPLMLRSRRDEASGG